MQLQSSSKQAMEQSFQLECICGKLLTTITASELMKRYEINVGVTCTYCTNLYEGDYIIYACDALRNTYHPNGYGFCYKCAENINDIESKKECNKPKYEQLLFQRVLNSMHFAQKNCSLPTTTQNTYDQYDHRPLLQTLRTLARIEGMSEYKCLQKALTEEQKKELEEKFETCTFDILDIEKRYNQLQKAVHENTNNEQQLLQLTHFIAYYKYAIVRMKGRVKKLNGYYDKFKQLHKHIDDQITDKLDYRYCICGRRLLEMILMDTEFGSYNCSICNILFECVESQKVFQCEMISSSIFHKDYAFSVCPDCIHKMNQCVKREFITDEIHATEKEEKKEKEKEKEQNDNEEKKDESEQKSEKKKIELEEYNKNLIIFALNRYDTMDKMLSKIKCKEEQKQNEDGKETKKWQKLSDLFYDTIKVLLSLGDYFTESDKDILKQRKHIIYDVMKANMPLCYCGDILTSVKASNPIDCHLCLRQEIKDTINVCLRRKECEYWDNKYYLCENCGDKIRYRPKTFVAEERIGDEILESIKNATKMNEDKDDEIENRDNEWSIIAMEFRRYQHKMKEVNKKKFQSIYNKIIEHFAAKKSFDIKKYEGDEIRLFWKGEIVNSENFECIWSKVNNTKTVWYHRMVLGDDNKVDYQLCTLSKPAFIKEIILDVMLFIPELSYFTYLESYKMESANVVWTILHKDINDITNDKTCKNFSVGSYICIRDMVDFEDNKINCYDQYADVQSKYEIRFCKDLELLKTKNENDNENDVLVLYHNKFDLSNQKLVSFWKKKNFVLIEEFECSLVDKYGMNDKILFSLEFKQSKNDGFGFQIKPRFLPEYIEQIELKFHLFVPDILIHYHAGHRSKTGMLIESIFDCNIFKRDDGTHQSINGEYVLILKKIYAKNDRELVTKQDVVNEQELIYKNYNKIRQDVNSAVGIKKIVLKMDNNLLTRFWNGETIIFDNTLTMDINIKNENKLVTNINNPNEINEKPLFLLDDMLFKFGCNDCDKIRIMFGCAKNSTDSNEDNQFTLYAYATDKPFYVDQLDLEIYVFIPLIEQFHKINLELYSAARDGLKFESTKLKIFLDEIDIEMYVKINSIKTKNKIGTAIKLDSYYDRISVFDNYKQHYNNKLQSTCNQKDINFFKLKIENTKWKQFWDGKIIKSDLYETKLIPHLIDDDNINPYNKSKWAVKIRKNTRKDDNFFHIQLIAYEMPKFVSFFVLTMHYFVPEIYYHHDITFKTSNVLNWPYQFYSGYLKGLESFTIKIAFNFKCYDANEKLINSKKDLLIAIKSKDIQYNKLRLSLKALHKKYTGSSSFQYNSLNVIGKDKKLFNENKIVKSNSFNLFPFDLLQYLVCGYLRMEFEENNNYNVPSLPCPLDIKVLCCKYMPNLFFAETLNMLISVTNNINTKNIRFGLHPTSKPVYIRDIVLDTHFLVPQTLFYTRSEAGYNKLTELTLDPDENIIKYQNLESFQFDFASQLLHSNVDIINMRKDYVNSYYEKRENLFKKLNDKSFKATIYQKFEIDGDDLRNLVKGNSRSDWIFLKNINFSFTLETPMIDKSNTEKGWTCKMVTNLNYCLIPSIQNYLGKFRYGVDAKANKDIGKVEYEIDFFRPQMLDHATRNGTITSGNGTILSNDGLTNIIKDNKFFSFHIEMFIFIKKVCDKKLNLIHIA